MRPTDRIRLSKKVVEDLLPFADARRHVYDDAVPGLAVCVTPRGSKSFYWIGRVGKSVSRLQLGKWPQMSIDAAREEAKRVSADVVSGVTPKPRKVEAKIALRLGNVWQWYFAEVAQKKHKSWRSQEKVWLRDWADWSRQRVADIRQADVVQRLNRIRDEYGPGAMNKAIDLIRNLYGTAKNTFGIDLIDFTQGLEKHVFESRDRFLKPEEVAKFFDAVNQLKQLTSRDFFRLCIFTGARRQNILEMRWDEIDLQAGEWRIPGSKSKNNREMRITLSDAALAVLQERKAASLGSQWVLPSTNSSTGHMTEPKAAMERIRELSGIENIRIHDLRRTLGSWQALTGASLIEIGKSLGHRSTSATQVYARLTDDSVSASINKAISAILLAAKTDSAETK